MDQIKIDNFNRENPDWDFPEYVKLGNKACGSIRSLLRKKLKLDSSSDKLALVNEVNLRGEIFSETKSDDENFNLKQTLNSLEVKLPERVLINWYRYDDINEIEFEDLVIYFDDIWYPAVDDIDIFDDTLKWILSISHSGEMKILRL